MALQPNSTFGNYQIGEVIGEGGMGQVYRATDTTLDREVAIKVLPESFAQDADRLSRFEREAKTLASLNHPNIAQIYGLEKQGDTTAIVMELVEGPTLAEKIAQGPMSADESLRIAKQIIDGLEAAHDKGIVHRDLKPANIKVRQDGSVKILDFGIAKPIDFMGASGGRTPTVITPAVTETGVIMGTAAYMSPEQARGKFVDQRTDIWAFGCVLYEMLTGQPAFGGEDVTVTLARIIERDADMESIPGMISPAVRNALSLCLRKDPKKRVHHIGDVRLALEGELESGFSGAAEGSGALVVPFWRRLAWPVIVIVAVIAASLGTQYMSTPPPPVAPEVTRWTHVLPPDFGLNYPVATAIDLSPDGRILIYGADGGLFRRNLDELEAQPIPGTAGDQPVYPIFSPDGETILYASGRDLNTKRISVNGGTPIPVLDGSSIAGEHWAGDRILYSGGGAGACQLSAVRPTGGASEVLFDLSEGFGCQTPRQLPNSDTIIYVRGQGGQASIWAFSPGNGEHTALFPGRHPSYVESGHLVYYDATLGLMARTFDPSTLEFGPEVAMVRDVLYLGFLAQYAVADNGTLAYVKGGGLDSTGNVLFTLDSNDKLETLDLPPAEYTAPSVSPDGNQLAVQIGSGDQAQIYIYDFDGGSEIRQLTFEGNNINPSWTPDGQWVTFTSTRGGRSRIWRQRADGTGLPEVLTNNEGERGQASPLWTPDGEYLTYGQLDADGNRRLWKLHLPDGNPELLIDSEGEQGAHNFSPAGNAIAYSQGGGVIFVEPYPRDGSRTRISGDELVSFIPVWSRDGTTIMYQTLTGEVMSVDITVPGFAMRNRRTLPIRGVPQNGIDSMPDGKWLMVAPPGMIGGNAGAGIVEIVVVENWIEDLKRLVPKE